MKPGWLKIINLASWCYLYQENKAAFCSRSPLCFPKKDKFANLCLELCKTCLIYCAWKYEKRNSGALTRVILH